MKTIFSLSLKAAARDPFLLFWSVLLPVGGTIGLGLLIRQDGFPLRVMTGMMASGVLFYAYTTTAFTILGQRRRGVYNLLRITPTRLWQYVVSVSGAWVLVSLACAVFVLAAGKTVLALTVPPAALLLLLPTVLLAAFGYVFLSFFVSRFCRTESHASMATNITSMPLLFLSDSFYSLDKAPDWLRAVSRVNPFEWFVSGLRGAAALDYHAWLLSLGLLAGVFAVTLALAVTTFRYTDF